MNFSKPFTQQEAIPADGIESALRVLRSGRLHRYNLGGDEEGEVSALEREYALWQGAPFCLALASGGQAIQIALRSAGVRPGDAVLANAYTLAPVPGALHAVGAKPVFVEVGPDWTVDLDDLEAKAGRARFLLLSHMRGHLADMERVAALCERHGLTLVEDCAHTMGSAWRGVRSGNHGHVACFSTQTYKHINSGEGGLLTTSDPEIAARAIVMSGSYMLYERHGAAPPPEAFEGIDTATPNCSARMDHLRAAILRPQLERLGRNVERWNERYRALESGLRGVSGIGIVERPDAESIVGSSFQFHAHVDCAELVRRCAGRGVELKWFGAERPVGFTSRFDSWEYLEPSDLPQTLRVLATTIDLRVPLTFTVDDCRTIATIVADEAASLSRSKP